MAHILSNVTPDETTPKLLRICKTCCHAECTKCELYKRDLRSGTLSLRARAQTMGRYIAHLVQ